MIAPFWADIRLCYPSARVYYEETTRSGVLRAFSAIKPFSGFTFTSALIVTYDHVQEYPCPSTADGNVRKSLHCYMLIIAMYLNTIIIFMNIIE